MSKTTIPTGGLADAAVTTAKITDANITTAKIADDAVTSAKSTANITVADLWRVTSGFTNSADPYHQIGKERTPMDLVNLEQV